MLTYAVSLAGEAEAAEAAECVIVAAGHNGIGLAFETALLVIGHVRNLIDILNELPALAHGLINGDSAAGIFIDAFVNGLIGEFALEVSVGIVLAVFCKGSRIIGLWRATPTAVAVVGI